MRAGRQVAEGRVYFVLAGLDPVERAAAGELGFEPFGAELARPFATDAPDLEQAYDGFRRCALPMLRQTAGLEPVPWEDALVTFLEAVRHRKPAWWLAGSAALAVRGLGVRPRDIDIITDGSGARALGELLAPHLVEPVVHNEGWVAGWWGRAFPGARLEWVGDVRTGVDEPEPVDYGPAAAARLEQVTWRGHRIQVPPLDLQLAVANRRGLTGRARLIEAALGRHRASR